VALREVDQAKLALLQRHFALLTAVRQGGLFAYLRVIQAQRAVQEAELEYTRALAEAWQAASVIAGLLLEEHWPPERREERRKEPPMNTDEHR
jgi:outer membrane protein TolC